MKGKLTYADKIIFQNDDTYSGGVENGKFDGKGIFK